MVRWPGQIAAGPVSNEIVQHHDWLPTFLAAAGEPDVVEKLKKGHEAGDKTFKVHIDGFNLLPYLTGRGRREPAPGVHLLLGRRRPRRAPLRQLEGRLHGAAGARDAAASGPSRSRPSGCRSSSTCARIRSSAPTSPRTPTGTGTWTRRYLDPRGRRRSSAEFLADVQGLPAAPEGRELHDRPGAREDGATPRAARADERTLCLLERHGDASRRSSISPRRRHEIRPARGTDRGLRQRRHALVREADAGRARLHPAAARRDGGEGRSRCARSSRGRRPTRRTTPGSAA